MRTRIAFASANTALYAALETEVPPTAVAETQGAIQDDFLSLSTACLEAHRALLRPGAPVSFVAEFLARWVGSVIHDFAMHAPAARTGGHLADGLIDAGGDSYERLIAGPPGLRSIPTHSSEGLDYSPGLIAGHARLV